MQSSVCVDASFIVRTLVPGPFSKEARILLKTWQEASTALISPSILLFEVLSTLRKLVYFHKIKQERADEAYGLFQQTPIHFTNRRTMFSIAWQIAINLNRPVIYDATYLALAQMQSCEFWTADERLYNTVKKQFSWVKWIGNMENNPINIVNK